MDFSWYGCWVLAEVNYFLLEQQLLIPILLKDLALAVTSATKCRCSRGPARSGSWRSKAATGSTRCHFVPAKKIASQKTKCPPASRETSWNTTPETWGQEKVCWQHIFIVYICTLVLKASWPCNAAVAELEIDKNLIPELPSRSHCKDFCSSSA